MNKVILGAANTEYDGWISTDRNQIDITDRTSFKRYEPISALMAEHVWEHLSEEDGLKAAQNCFDVLPSGGRLRIAVPDGYKPDPEYINWVKVGGGEGKNGHKVLYNYKSLSKLLMEVGFRVMLLEHWDKSGQFHSKEWLSGDGHIARSMKHDRRNVLYQLTYTSLILDAIKP